jgi:hypothetical protein
VTDARLDTQNGASLVVPEDLFLSEATNPLSLIYQ